MTLPPAVTTWGLRGALVLAGALAGGIAQRYLGTPQVEVRTVVKDVVHDVIHETVKVEVREVAAKAVTKVVYRERTTTPDGTCHETSIEHTNAVATSGKDTVSAGAKDTVHEAAHEAVTVTTPVNPRWRVALLAGASIKEPLLPLAGPLVLGAEVDYRFAGPFALGAWATTYGAAGASLSIAF